MITRRSSPEPSSARFAGHLIYPAWSTATTISNQDIFDVGGGKGPVIR